MIFFQKLRAGSLQFVLFIGAVIAVLLLTFVLLSYTHIHFSKKGSRYVELIAKNDLVIRLALKSDGNTLANTSFSLDETKDVETIIEREKWGIFDLYTATSSFEKMKFENVALVGAGIRKAPLALYLKDNSRPLVIAGKAKIEGNVLLPKQGIRPGNINGKPYAGVKLVYGNQRESKPMLPSLNPIINENIEALCSSSFVPNTANSINLSRNTIYSNSFLEDTLFIIGETIQLTDVSLTGNIVVMASNTIIVNSSSVLKDIILSAPTIVVNDGVKATFQAFASKHISIGRNCSLNYPSALVVFENSQPKINLVGQSNIPQITVAPNSEIKGVIIYKNRNQDKMFYPQIRIAPNASVVGQLYCEKNLELKGSITGSVFTDSFMAFENGNVYQNHLFNGRINAIELQEQFVGLGINDFSYNKNVVKWLY